MHVGIIGSGQLARMLALAGLPLGIRFSFLLGKHDNNRCVEGLGRSVWIDDQDQEGKGKGEGVLREFARGVDVVTIESEQVNLDWLAVLQRQCEVYPSVQAIRILKNRSLEKQLLQSLNIATSPHINFRNGQELLEQAEPWNTYPLVIKSACNGYDGNHQHVIHDKAALQSLAQTLPDEPHIAEAFIPFTREVSFIAARASDGTIKFYAPTENYHCDGVLQSSIAPAPKLSPRLIKQAHRDLTEILNHLDYVGILAMECFEVQDESDSHLVVNEIAPRVHNSGHWTQTGCQISQFENHLRAILGLPLGTTRHRGVTGMFNLLGKESFDWQHLGANVSLHWYNKTLRQRRKMGHINIQCDSFRELDRTMLRLSSHAQAEMSTKERTFLIA